MSEPTTATVAPSSEPPIDRPRRWRRRLRVLGLILLAMLLVLTLSCLVYNGLTAHRRSVPTGLSYVDAGGVHTRYRQWGSTGTAVVLVHGAAESADTWDRVGPLLAATHRVYAYDVVGWGYSQRTGRYTLDDEVRQLLGLLDALGLDRPVLVGHSSGAAAIAEASLREPARVGGVLFLDGDALSTGAGARSPVGTLLLPPYRITLLRLALRSDWVIRSVYSAQCGPSCAPLDAAGVDRWRRPLAVPGAEAALWSLVRQGVPGLPPDRLAGLRAIPAPRAVVFGALDDVFSPDTPASTAARIGAPPPTVIAGGHHLTMISHPEQVANAIDSLAARRPG